MRDSRWHAESDGAPRYDVMVLDAFSGDAVPIHLFTAEAIALYRRRLKPEGVLAFHVSSQYVDLALELAVQADQAGLSAVSVHAEGNERPGEFASDWVLMTANRAFWISRTSSILRPVTRKSTACRSGPMSSTACCSILRWETPKPARLQKATSARLEEFIHQALARFLGSSRRRSLAR